MPLSSKREPPLAPISSRATKPSSLSHVSTPAAFQHLWPASPNELQAKSNFQTFGRSTPISDRCDPICAVWGDPSCSYCYENRSLCVRLIFFSQHGPFPSYLKRFHLSDSDYCSCGGIGTALHYATECIYTVSWHMRKPAPNFEQEWLKRVANNLVSRQKIRGIIKFMSENRDLFRPP
ncbi:hypothetical protein AVEN_44343-1 [Araneus ventricosus]|uniref:Uncharacterized protein n=1 Tax=Araneus ventricosus TaxID=182803 RepID=A0A4Y2KL36_ARAVE|nr:hypothetical protein AVEN_44343-1 [Araneus ventricosus]